MKFYDWNISEGRIPPARAGIYVLLLKKQIPKLYKKDGKGILYIGVSSKLNKRLAVGRHKNWGKFYEKDENRLMFNHSTLTFTVDIDRNSNLHPHKSSIDDGILKKSDRLYLRYALTSKYPAIEKQLLLGHIMLYGQLPPFNNKGPTLKYIWDKMSDNKWKQAITTYKQIIGKV